MKKVTWLGVVNKATIVMMFENIIVQTLIWGTPMNPRSHISPTELFISFVSLALFIGLVYSLIRLKKAHTHREGDGRSRTKAKHEPE